ncbi:hypothetical protein thsrh120_63300 [Rhizobium sp. No.120]
MNNVLASTTGNFGQLIGIAGLDPSVDLQNADLRNTDFTDTNLANYNFTGCDLRGARGIRVVWDPETTLFAEALLDGSIFAHRVATSAAFADPEVRLLQKRVSGMGWQDQIVWAIRNLRPGTVDLERNRMLASTLFEQTRDSFLKGELLKYLEQSASSGDEQIYNIMLDIINGHSDDLHLVTKTIKVLQRSRAFGRTRLKSAVEALLYSRDSRVVTLAIRFLVSVGTTQEIRELSEFALARRAAPLRFAFIGALIGRLGPGYDIVVRNPVNRDFRDVHQELSAEELPLLIREIRRAYYNEQEALRDGTLKGEPRISQEFATALAEDSLLEKLDQMFGQLAEHGMPRVRIPGVVNHMN